MKRIIVLFGFVLLALGNVFIQDYVGVWAWVLFAMLLCLLHPRSSGLIFEWKLIRQNWRPVAWSVLVVLFGLLLFLFLGVSRYFMYVASYAVFIVWIPIAEELLFRGWMFGVLERYRWYPIVATSALFSLHHIQYGNYQITRFLLFQMAYTFMLGIFLGTMRKASGNIYLGILLHIFINLMIIFPLWYGRVGV